MGYVLALAACYSCGRPFTFNPYLVPSTRVDGQREPICYNCVLFANPIRRARGLEPIVPLPGAYDPGEEEG